MNIVDRTKKLVRTLTPNLWVFIKGNKFLFSRDSYLNGVGYIESMRKEKPCDSNGAPLPWMNYGIIGLLQKRLSKSHALFEYGSGNSTLFWSRQVGQVVSVEHDESWFQRVSEGLPENAELKLRAESISSYVESIEENGNKYDVIVVDGIARNECLLMAPKMLKSTGVIVFDDSNRKCWAEGVDYLIRNGFRQLSISGLKPNGFGFDETSIFYRENNCFGI